MYRNGQPPPTSAINLQSDFHDQALAIARARPTMDICSHIEGPEMAEEDIPHEEILEGFVAIAQGLGVKIFTSAEELTPQIEVMVAGLPSGTQRGRRARSTRGPMRIGARSRTESSDSTLSQ